MPTREDIVSQLRQALATSDPDLDTTIGTPTRRILDAVAGVVSEAYTDQYLLNYTYDVDSKTGADLDAFVALFGFSRLEARRSLGTVVFERVDPAPFNIFIPMGTQLSTSDRVVFYTTVPAQIPVGGTEVEVPIRAVVGGTSGNVAASAINQWVTSIPGINSFSNPSATTSGSSEETDEDLRVRFKKTVFRNLAGTEDMFLGLALEDKDALQANVIGASKRYREQIELVDFGGILGVSSVQDAKYVYGSNVIFGEDIEGGDILNQNIHYSFIDSTPPVVVSEDSTLVPVGIYELEFDYVPQASRNNPEVGITNAIDLYVDGLRERTATETTIWSPSVLFTNDSGSDFYAGNYRRRNGANPTVGNIFIDLTFGPVIDLPNSIVVSGNTYTEGTHYWLINDVTADGGSPQSYSGIEWKSAANGGTEPSISPNPPSFTLTYAYNEVPSAIETKANLWRLVTTDLRVHQARRLRLTFNFAVVLNSGYSQATALADLTTTISAKLAKIGFNGIVQVSDILASAASVAGVDAVRLLTSADDPTNYGIQQFADDGSTLLTNWSISGRAVDVPLGDDEVPTLNDINIVVKAANTFGSV